MYQTGEQLLYGIHGICTVTDLQERTVDRKKILYYVLESKESPGSVFYVPAHNPAAVAKLRKLLTRQELDALLASREVREDAWIDDENRRRQTYRELIAGGDRCHLLRMVRSLLRHKQLQLAAGRKFHQSDENFLRDAQKLLCSEFSSVLALPPDQVGDYIRRAVGAEDT